MVTTKLTLISLPPFSSTLPLLSLLRPSLLPRSRPQMFDCAAMAQVKLTRGAKGLSVKMATSVGVMSTMYIARGVSGAHLNPAVSLSCVLGRLSLNWKILSNRSDQIKSLHLTAEQAFPLLTWCPPPPLTAVVLTGISQSMSSNCGGGINPARDLGSRLLTLTAGWGTEVFTCYNYWFWVPIVALGSTWSSSNGTYQTEIN
ncbi:aquaporin-10-like [Oncorhynchus clarkii lewisi]|uniref:aquaporin-10-like n=1 Tax=Oncorhynchus clarkii lewisi TaxID=490388 RepID=UPI0039B8923B